MNGKPLYRRIPGFRSGKWWKMILATVFYLFVLLAIIGQRQLKADYAKAKVDGLAAIESGDWSVAAEYLKKADARDEEVIEALRKAETMLESQLRFDGGKEAMAKGDWDTAVTELSRVDKAFPGYNEVRELLEESKAQKAVVDAEKSREALARARELYKDKDYDLAMLEIDTALGLDPGNKEVEDLRATIEAELQKQEEERLIAEIAEKQNVYDRDTGSIGIAVVGAEAKKSFSDGFMTYTAKGENATYIFVAVNAKNFGKDTQHVNPNDFTLSAPNGYSASHATVTYSLSNYFDAVDLPPDKHTVGWLVFVMPKYRFYTLHYNGLFVGSATKQFVIE